MMTNGLDAGKHARLVLSALSAGYFFAEGRQVTIQPKTVDDFVPGQLAWNDLEFRCEIVP
jgi:hypothetical protein